MPTGKTPGEIFAANAHRSYFTFFAYFHLHHILNKIPTWKLFTLTFVEKSKPEEMSLKTKKLSKIAKVLQCDASPGKS